MLSERKQALSWDLPSFLNFKNIFATLRFVFFSFKPIKELPSKFRAVYFKPNCRKFEVGYWIWFSKTAKSYCRNPVNPGLGKKIAEKNLTTMRRELKDSTKSSFYRGKIIRLVCLIYSSQLSQTLLWKLYKILLRKPFGDVLLFVFSLCSFLFLRNFLCSIINFDCKKAYFIDNLHEC